MGLLWLAIFGQGSHPTLRARNRDFGRHNCSLVSYFVTSDNKKCTVRLLTVMGGKTELCWDQKRRVDATSARDQKPEFPGFWLAWDLRYCGVPRSSIEIFCPYARLLDLMCVYIRVIRRHNQPQYLPIGQKRGISPERPGSATQTKDKDGKDTYFRLNIARCTWR